jgi:uncharacterized protein (TIGR00251 family)
MKLRSYCTITSDGLILSVKVIPKSSTNSCGGIISDAQGREWMKIKITAPAEDGKANKALIKFLSQLCDISPSAIRVVTGETSRSKILHLSGHSPTLSALLSGAAAVQKKIIT